MDRADIGNIKGIYHISINDDVTVNFTENTYSSCFVKVRFDETENDMQTWCDIVKNNYVDIVFTTKDLEKCNINKFAESLYEMGAKRIEVIEEKTNIVMDTEDPDIQNMKAEDITIENMFIAKVDKLGLEETMWSDLTKVNEYYMKKAQDELGYK